MRTRKKIQKSTVLSIGNTAGTVHRLWEKGGLQRHDNPKIDPCLKPWQGGRERISIIIELESGRVRVNIKSDRPPFFVKFTLRLDVKYLLNNSKKAASFETALSCKSLFLITHRLVAGVGFEPTTFRL